MTYATLQEAARARHLRILGGFHPTPDDKAPVGCRTLILLGPDEPAFWPAFTASPEYRDGAADPMDRWSERVIGGWAQELEAEPVFPFGGPPFLPFFTWATRTGRIQASPVNFLVHDQSGLLVSFRGALALRQQIELPPSPNRPCDTCAEKPCLTTCPVNALTPDGYDVAACKAYLDTPPGIDCMANGCQVRRSCPVSRTWGRLPAQSAFHMTHFHRRTP